MKTQTIILTGVLLFWTGWVCDGLLLPYFFLLNYAGVAITFWGVGKWLTIKENRQWAKEVIGFGQRKSFLDLIKIAFDFSWKRLSVLWTFVSIMAMIMTHGMNLLFKSSDAYKTAIESISYDSEIIELSGGIVHFSDNVSGQIGAENKINIGIVGKEKSFLATVILDFDVESDKYTIKSIVTH
jgi:hypothetical protein